jgi:hypothetical protein
MSNLFLFKRTCSIQFSFSIIIGTVVNLVVVVVVVVVVVMVPCCLGFDDFAGVK